MSTLIELQEELAEFKKARRAVLMGGQEYDAPGGRATKRASLETLNAEIKRLEMRIELLSNGGALSHAQPVFRGRE